MYGQVPTELELRKLYEMSPLVALASRPAAAPPTQVPLLLLLGTDDRRVPPAQGTELYRWLKAHGWPVQMHLYPGANHQLAPVPVEADCFVHICAWFHHYHSSH